MPKVVGVKFKPVTKTYYFLPNGDADLHLQDPVIVETSRGQELGWIVMEATEVSGRTIKGTLKPILRRATPLDLMKMAEYRLQEADALERCKKKVAELELPMKMVQAEYSYDGSKLLFLFSAEQRVDFRKLVRYLVRSFRTRIEMRQIGARDEAKVIDGYGRCGRQLCCSSWLTEFHPVSIRMAKNQSLPLAPTEISGACGRLLCCLAYEDAMYTDIRKTMPRPGTVVETARGRGTIKGLNILKESAIVAVEEGTKLELPVEELTILAVPEPRPAPQKANKRKSRKKKNQPAKRKK
ncbi:MAG: stage 0 sporulation family protein [Anaerolineae bacterium]